MLARIIFVASLYVLQVAAFAAVGKRAARPECVSKCWEYTQYVNQACLGDTMCLCNDSEYQNAVYQCLYSQCVTAQFANALHHTLGICHEAEQSAQLPDTPPQAHEPEPEPEPSASPTQRAAPPLLKQDAQRAQHKKRAMPYQSASNSVNRSVTRSAGGASVTRSAGPSVMRSAGPSAMPTRSVQRGMQSVSASGYQGMRGSARAAPTLSVAMPMYRRAR